MDMRRFPLSWFPPVGWVICCTVPWFSRRSAQATYSSGLPSPGWCLSVSTKPCMDTGITLQVGYRSLDKRWQVWVTCSLKHFLPAYSMQLPVRGQESGFECLFPCSVYATMQNILYQWGKRGKKGQMLEVGIASASVIYQTFL